MKLFLAILPLMAPLFAAEHKVIFPAGAKPIGPYSPGIMVGDFLYVSGQGARDANNNFAASPEERVRQCLNNVKAIVSAAGLTMEHIVYTQVYLHKDTSYEVMNKVWDEFFPKNPPGRATLGLHRMPTETTVEISAVAVRELSMKKPIKPDWYPKKMNIAPAVEAGGRIYLSGFLGRDINTGKVPDDPAQQVTLALTRVQQILEAAGLDFRHLVFVNPYLTKNIPRRVMDDLYAKRFEFGNTPARATIEVAFLPLGANIEFTGVAVRDLSQRKAIRPKNMPPSPTASPCVFGGDTLYCSAKAGFIPGPNGGIYADTVEGQTRMTMRSLLDGLEEAGLNFSNVVASNVYLDNMDDFAKMNGVYGKFFPAAAPPTRTTVSPVAPVERKTSPTGHYPKLEEISVVAVK
ncbi:MAG TPA: RidA family protein [Bryobacteraceae bacterium]|nr:RidA family protein [Bryobacteraceae bacterium]